MRILMYGSENAAPASRMCTWAVQGGHQVIWAGYLGEVAGHTGARHVRIRSADNPGPELDSIAHEFKPHLAHAHNCSFLGAVHIKRQLGPIIVSAFGALNPLISDQSRLNSMVQHMLEANPTTIVESEVLLAATKARFPGLPCELLPLGVNTRRFRKVNAAQRSAWRKTLGVPEDGLIFFSVRGIGDGYNHDMIIDAFAKAMPGLPGNAMLAFIKLTRSWDRQKMEQDLQERADKLGIGSRLLWLPEVRHEMMPGMFGISDIVINYPRADAFPSSMLEAAACEVPFLTGNLPAYRGSCIEKFGRLVEPMNVDALAQAITGAATHEHKAMCATAALARAHVSEHFNEDVQRAKLLALYETVAANAGR